MLCLEPKKLINPNIFVHAKRAVYEESFLSILFYGAKSWCLTEKFFSMLPIFHNLCVRSMHRVTYCNRMLQL